MKSSQERWNSFDLSEMVKFENNPFRSGIAHRNLTCENIVFDVDKDKNFIIKIIDFVTAA